MSWYSRNLNVLILLGVILGGFCGYAFPNASSYAEPFGYFFLRGLQALVVPVIIFSVLAAVLGTGGTKSLGRLGGLTLSYYFLTTSFAVLIGLAAVSIVQPGKGLGLSAPEQAEHIERSLGARDILERIIPSNIVQPLVEGNALGIISITILFSIALLLSKHPGVEIIRSANAALFAATAKLVDWLMMSAPIGTFGLMFSLTAHLTKDSRLAEVGSALGYYAFTVIFGLLLHAVFVLGGICRLVGASPKELFRCVFPALLTAFSTASSSATLPLTLENLRKRANVSEKASGFVASLGATVNMDGTALYEAVAAIFIANAFGIELGFTETLTIFFVATLSAIGAASIPGAGLIMMSLVLGSVGLPLAGIQLIIVVDRILDMCRTSVNVWGDCVGAKVVQALDERLSAKAALD